MDTNRTLLGLDFRGRLDRVSPSAADGWRGARMKSERLNSRPELAQKFESASGIKVSNSVPGLFLFSCCCEAPRM
jgi:hypothetical protein